MNSTPRPLPELDRISDYVTYYAEHMPRRVALVQGKQCLTYFEFHSAVQTFGRALLAAGIGKGDRVAMLATPCIEFSIVYMATASIGAIWLGLNPKHRLAEFRYLVGDARPSVLVVQVHIDGRDYSDDIGALREEYQDIQHVVSLDDDTLVRSTGFAAFVATGEDISMADYHLAQAQVSRTDPALLVYTSGSTGDPKGAMLTHQGMIVCRLVEAAHWGVDQPRTLVNVPIDHITGADEIPDYCLVAGGTLYFMERFGARATLELVQRERLNFILQFPTQFQLMIALPDFDEFDLSSLECLVWMGAPASRDLLARLHRLDARLVTAWGQTEVSGEVTFTDAGADFEVLANTIGRPDPRFELRLCDSEGRLVPQGEPGEIQVRGEILMAGYYARPEATAEAIDENGWLHTGDVGRERADGNLELVGRLKQMYKSGGYNVYPREIEVVIESHPAVAMAAVVAVPDALYQEVGHAFVETEQGVQLSVEEIADHCRLQLANYKIPKAFDISPDLPKLSTGKIDKKTLQARTCGSHRGT